VATCGVKVKETAGVCQFFLQEMKMAGDHPSDWYVASQKAGSAEITPKSSE